MTQRLSGKGPAPAFHLRLPSYWMEVLEEKAWKEREQQKTDPYEDRKRQRQIRGWGTIAGIIRRAIARRLNLDLELPQNLWPPVPYWKDGQRKRPGARTKAEKRAMEEERKRILAEYAERVQNQDLPGLQPLPMDQRWSRKRGRPTLAEIHAKYRAKHPEKPKTAAEECVAKDTGPEEVDSYWNKHG